MKKGILIIVLILVLVGIGYGAYYFWSNSETQLRKSIEDAYYENQYLEVCKFNNYKGFVFIENCESAIRCFSLKIVELVRKDDLKELSKKMKWSDDAESTMAEYLRTISIDYQIIDPMAQRCLDENGFDVSLIE